MSERPFVYRFEHDLRLEAHRGLRAAAACGPVLPALIIDRSLSARLARSRRRAAFFCGAVAALDRELAARGSRLIVRRGQMGATLLGLARASGASGAAWSANYDPSGVQRDTRLQSELEENGLRAAVVHDAATLAPEALGAAREGIGYRAFAPYFEAWRASLNGVEAEDSGEVRFAASDLHSEPLPAPSEFGAFDLDPAAGSAQAHAQLERFLLEAVRYASAAVVPSDDGTSHLCAHLSFGTLAARSVVRAVLRRLEDPFLLGEERFSLRLFLRSMAHRDFFLQLAWFHPETEREPLQGKMRGFPWRRDHASLDAWRAGRTGYPLVDAGIRQLQATGTMHPHVRAVAASFLCYDLGVDWRVGCEEWDRWSSEDDPAIALGNWQWIAGVGADMAPYPRIYNPVRQQHRYDPAGAYVRRWIPELAGVPVGWHAGAGQAQLALELFPHDAYPDPVVDHEIAGRAFLVQYRAFVERSRAASPVAPRR